MTEKVDRNAHCESVKNYGCNIQLNVLVSALYRLDKWLFFQNLVARVLNEYLWCNWLKYRVSTTINQAIFYVL